MFVGPLDTSVGVYARPSGKVSLHTIQRYDWLHSGKPDEPIAGHECLHGVAAAFHQQLQHGLVDDVGCSVDRLAKWLRVDFPRSHGWAARAQHVRGDSQRKVLRIDGPAGVIIFVRALSRLFLNPENHTFSRAAVGEVKLDVMVADTWWFGKEDMHPIVAAEVIQDIADHWLELGQRGLRLSEHRTCRDALARQLLATADALSGESTAEVVWQAGEVNLQELEIAHSMSHRLVPYYRVPDTLREHMIEFAPRHIAHGDEHVWNEKVLGALPGQVFVGVRMNCGHVRVLMADRENIRQSLRCCPRGWV
jgi:hypothetical protein